MYPLRAYDFIIGECPLCISTTFQNMHVHYLKHQLLLATIWFSKRRFFFTKESLLLHSKPLDINLVQSAPKRTVAKISNIRKEAGEMRGLRNQEPRISPGYDFTLALYCRGSLHRACLVLSCRSRMNFHRSWTSLRMRKEVKWCRRDIIKLEWRDRNSSVKFHLLLSACYRKSPSASIWKYQFETRGFHVCIKSESRHLKNP